MTTTFSPKVLQSDRCLESYLSGKETIEKLKSQAKSPYVQGQGKLGALQVTWIAMTSPLGICGAIFLKATGFLLLYVFDARKEGMRLLATASQMQDHSLRWGGCLLFGSNLLVSTLNTPLPAEAHDIYAHPPIPLSKLPDAKIQLRFGYGKRGDHFLFNDINGQCAGMSNFANHLHFQTKHAFKNEEHQLVAIAEQFQNGTGKEATLWQNGQIVVEPFCKPLFGMKRSKGEKICFTAEKLQSLMKKLKPGVHEVHLRGERSAHRMNFFKGKHCDYVFDPSIGLIALRTPEDHVFWSYYLAFTSVVDGQDQVQFCHLSR